MPGPIDPIDQRKKQNAYLDFYNASQYLTIRSTAISPANPLLLTSESLRALIKDNQLRSIRIGSSGPFLFKEEWLEAFLKKEYGDEYAKPEAGNNLGV